MKENVKQSNLANDGCWVEVEIPKDENIIELDIGDEFIGIYVGNKPNENFEGEIIHIFETENGNLRMMYGKTFLNKILKNVHFGCKVKVKRLDDKKIGQPKPLHMFKVWVWEAVEG